VPPDGCTPGCGACCRFLVLQVNPQYLENADVARWVELHSIKLRRRGLGVFATIPLACDALTDEGMCSIHPDRPDVCRSFPQSEAAIDIIHEEVGQEVCTVKFDMLASVAEGGQN
jgi:Fe-S-cluster containining protein